MTPEIHREKHIIIFNDCHLSAGRSFEGKLNPHEDFFFDDEMSDLLEFYSTGEYGDGVAVELIINGDFFDYLNVPTEGEFEDLVTEKMAVDKTEAIIQGHPGVMKALRDFAARPGKEVTYLIGNHDADLFFPGVRARILKEWDPSGHGRTKILHETDRITYPEGVEVRHGNQFEPGSQLEFDRPFLTSYREEPVLNLPWGSTFVLKIVNRMRYEREYLDKVRPMKIFLIFSLLFDPWFTIRFCFLTSFYFLKTRFIFRRKSKLRNTLEILKQETRVLQNLEEDARKVLDANPALKTVIFGHTHLPMNKIWPDGKQYINTGTWTKMVHLELRSLGQQIRLTFGYVRLKDGRAECELRQWVGEHSPHKVFSG